MNPVLDASLFIAAISPLERHHRLALAMFGDHPIHLPFLVPALFRVEVVAALSRRGESDELLDVVDALAQGPRFHAFMLTDALVSSSVQIGRKARLRAYDAVYVALALKRQAPLWTLDREMAGRAREAYPELVVRVE